MRFRFRGQLFLLQTIQGAESKMICDQVTTIEHLQDGLLRHFAIHLCKLNNPRLEAKIEGSTEVA
jgi:hypothetical protein